MSATFPNECCSTREGCCCEPDYAAEMRLPSGKSCADCRNGPRCDALFGAVRRGFTTCDFWPSRFVSAPPKDPTR